MMHLCLTFLMRICPVPVRCNLQVCRSLGVPFDCRLCCKMCSVAVPSHTDALAYFANVTEVTRIFQNFEIIHFKSSLGQNKDIRCFQFSFLDPKKSLEPFSLMEVIWMDESCERAPSTGAKRDEPLSPINARCPMRVLVPSIQIQLYI